MNDIQKRFLLHGYDFPIYIKVSRVCELYCNENSYVKILALRGDGDFKFSEHILFRSFKLVHLNHLFIPNISFLSEINTELTEFLKLEGNNIKDISILSRVNFPKLKEVRLESNEITNIDFILDWDLPKTLEIFTMTGNPMSLEHRNHIYPKMIRKYPRLNFII